MKSVQYPNFKFEAIYDYPVFDISLHHARMACCYKDKVGKYHLFLDYIEASLNTLHSFQAILNYYTSFDLKSWSLISTAVEKGNFNYENGKGDADCYGIGSPDVLCTDEYIYLFYAGRGSLSPDKVFNGLAHPGEPGYISCDIMFAKAPADKNGAPCGPFKKQGVVLNREHAWESMRIDDPCVLLDGNNVHLYYKGFNDNSNRNSLKLGYAVANISDMNFKKHPDPILSVYDGLEMPRVFKHKDTWNMFLRHFEIETGAFWRHYISDDGLKWKIKNASLFNCAGPIPGSGATDMMLIKDFDGSLSGMALACGLENGILKLWLYDVIIQSEQ